MMARIYGQAEQVLVWLGPAEKGSDAVMDFYSHVGRTIVSAGLDQYCTRDLFPVLDAAVAARDPQDELWQRASAVQELARRLLIPRLRALVEWDKRAWFGRVWVIQEFCVGAAESVFVCGGKRVSANIVRNVRLLQGLRQTHDFVDAARQLDGGAGIALLQAFNLGDPTPAFFRARGQRQRGTALDLLELLRHIYVGRDARAKYAEDRVFSLLGLVTDADQLGVQVDYSRTAVQVLTDVARAIVRRGQLFILGYSQFPKDVPGLPSWVPDWHSKLSPTFYPYWEFDSDADHFFTPSGSDTPVVLQTRDHAVLGLRGMSVDTVEVVGDIWRDDGESADPLRHQQYLAQICHLCRLSAAKNQPIYASQRRRDEAEWRVPIADIWEANEPGPGRLQRATDRAREAYVGQKGILDWFDSARRGILISAMPDGPEPSFYRLSMAKMSGMRPFMTGLGYVGVGPAGTGAGDTVVIFHGSRLCSVLRPETMSPASARRYFYIGEAYCDGVMNGELVGQRSDLEEFYLV
jgi:hypothetical protein